MAAKITYRKTKTNEWVAYGPAAMVKPGAQVTVAKRDGTTKVETIAGVGKAFTAAGVTMVYGYLAPSARNRNTPASSGSCDECGERRGTIPAHDLSGIPGLVCARCNRTGDLSFA